MLSQDIGLSELWYSWLGQGLGALTGRQVGPGWDLFSASSFKLIHSFFLFAKWAPLMDGGDIWFSGGCFGTDVSSGLFERDLPALIASKLPPPVGKQSATDSPAAAHPH